MWRDVSTVAEGSKLEGEVVVVGAGPMGIVTALELADRGHRVLLIESGGDQHDFAAQQLSETVSTGNDQWHVASTLAVRRQIGGTSVLWGGRCVPFDPIDFEPRPHVPERLWPVTYNEMSAHLRRACEWCVCGEPTFDASLVPAVAQSEMIQGLPDDEVLTTSLERWSLPTRFGKHYRKRLQRHPTLTVMSGLTCVHIACRADGAFVDHLDLKALSGAAATAVALHYVLATGGLEATRLLMASSDVHPNGIGNHSGHLGRWYMAHVEARVARLHLATPPDTTIYNHERDSDGVYVRRRFTIAPEVQRRDDLLNAAVWIVNPEMGDPSHHSGILSGVYLTLVSPLGRFLLAEAIRRAGTKTSQPAPMREHLRNVARDLLPAAKFAAAFSWQHILRPGRKAPGFFVRSEANIYPLHYHGEHLPHWESRVELSSVRDALGLPRLRTQMHYNDRDIRNVRSTLAHIDRNLRAHRVGHLEYLYADVDAAVWKYLVGNAGYHQMGLTRMSASAQDGVVTPSLNVHGIPNLSIASTSVFPTSGQANPTLTGVAFATRLAAHLATALSVSASQPPSSSQAAKGHVFSPQV